MVLFFLCREQPLGVEELSHSYIEVNPSVRLLHLYDFTELLIAI